MLYTLAIAVLFLFSLPLYLVVAVLIMGTSGWPIVFRQKRIGKHGVSFVMYKFRTMIVGAHAMQAQYSRLNISSGPVFKIPHDPRFTRLGKFLSHTGLDELPQLWNVLRGEMALFGPRPLPVDEAKKLAPWMQKRHEVLPGIISPAILSGKYHENFDAWMRSDVVYAKTKSMQQDTVILCRSIGFLCKLFIRSVWYT